MDPQATWNSLLDEWADRNWQNVIELAEALIEWLDKRGCPPEVIAGRSLGVFWNEPVVRFCCQFAADIAQRVLDSPNGIPKGVPFSLSCSECDCASPDSYEQAVHEGWTAVEFYPEGVAENFLGACPEHSG